MLRPPVFGKLEWEYENQSIDTSSGYKHFKIFYNFQDDKGSKLQFLPYDLTKLNMIDNETSIRNMFEIFIHELDDDQKTKLYEGDHNKKIIKWHNFNQVIITKYRTWQADSIKAILAMESDVSLTSELEKILEDENHVNFKQISKLAKEQKIINSSKTQLGKIRRVRNCYLHDGCNFPKYSFDTFRKFLVIILQKHT